jgi:hypothetical protein
MNPPSWQGPLLGSTFPTYVDALQHQTASHIFTQTTDLLFFTMAQNSVSVPIMCSVDLLTILSPTKPFPSSHVSVRSLVYRVHLYYRAKLVLLFALLA